MLRALTGAVALAAATLAAPAVAADITGAGATFPYPIYAKWADAYRKQTGVGLNYQSTSAPPTCRSLRKTWRRRG
jgi:phosphate transport system substrate-binding protein